MLKLDDQLKSAILRMPQKEKDKLLLRLAAKDVKLVRRLIFELLEGGETRDERANTLRAEIAADLAQSAKDNYMTPGYLLLSLRHWSGRITEHAQATKDKPGEVILNFFLLAEAFRTHGDLVRSFPERRSDTLAPYVTKKVASLLKKAEKLHEDYYMEYRSDAQEVLAWLWAFRPMAVLAKSLDLPEQL